MVGILWPQSSNHGSQYLLAGPSDSTIQLGHIVSDPQFRSIQLFDCILLITYISSLGLSERETYMLSQLGNLRTII